MIILIEAIQFLIIVIRVINIIIYLMSQNYQNQCMIIVLDIKIIMKIIYQFQAEMLKIKMWIILERY